jgi:chromatin remodeling complex protein RSC6
LPLTSPVAYEQALAYDAPVREKHAVSEFVRKRGYLARNHSNEPQEKEQHTEQPVKDPPAGKEKWQSNKSSKNNKRAGGGFERQKPMATEKTYNEKEPEERKPYKKPDRAPGAPDFR